MWNRNLFSIAILVIALLLTGSTYGSILHPDLELFVYDDEESYDDEEDEEVDEQEDEEGDEEDEEEEEEEPSDEEEEGEEDDRDSEGDEEDDEEDDEYQDEEEGGDEDYEDEYDDWRDKKSKKKKRKYYQHEIDVTSLRTFETDNGRFAILLGTQYNQFTAQSRLRSMIGSPFSLLSNTLFNKSRSLRQQVGTPSLDQATSIPHSSSTPVTYNAWPSVSAGFNTELYLFQSGIHGLGIDLNYHYTFYSLTITLKAQKVFPTTAVTHNASGHLVYRLYPFSKVKSLILMPKIGYKLFMFDGNDIYPNKGAPLYFFLDAVYLGADFAPLNFIFFLPMGDDNLDVGIKGCWEIFYQPTYTESKRRFQYTGGRGYITGSARGIKPNMLNHFITAGLTTKFKKSWGLDFLIGYYALDIFFNPYFDPEKGAVVDNVGIRGGSTKYIYNASVKDRYYNFLVSMYFLF